MQFELISQRVMKNWWSQTNNAKKQILKLKEIQQSSHPHLFFPNKRLHYYMINDFVSEKNKISKNFFGRNTLQRSEQVFKPQWSNL